MGLSTSSIGLPSDHTFQPGGTCTAILGRWLSKQIDRGQDNLGSCSWVCLWRRRGRLVQMITAYRTLQDNGSSIGADTAYLQQETILSQQGQQDPRPRAQVLSDLQK